MYRCSDCKRKHRHEPDKAKKLFDSKACHYFDIKPRHQYRADHVNKGNPTILYKNCIGNHYNGYWAGYINYYQSYEKGIMPFVGGLMEQPSKLVAVMDLVHNLIRENEQEVDRKNKLARKPNGR